MTRYSPLRLRLSAIAALTLCGCADRGPGFAGVQLYADNCAVCHGVYADGEGPAAATIPQTVPDLRQIALSNGGDFPRDQIGRIIDGREIIDAHRSDVMPRWGEEFQPPDGARGEVKAKIRALVDYLESIQFTE